MNKENNPAPSTIVFVDYESWFWALYNQYGETPDLRGFIQDIKQRGKLKQIFFFGDFTREEMAKEKQKLRTVSNEIIDCATEGTSKNYTDFIMLDYIYRNILQDQNSGHIDQYILVTGDGHFHGVVAYLTTFIDKIVGVYGVQGSLSNQLKNCASWHVEIQPKMDLEYYQRYLLSNIRYVQKYQHPVIPVFSKTVKKTASHYNLDEPKCTAALSKLIRDGYIDQEIQRLPDGRKINALVPKWDQLIQDGLWDPDEEIEMLANDIQEDNVSL